MFIAKNGVVQWAPFLNRTRVFFLEGTSFLELLYGNTFSQYQCCKVPYTYRYLITHFQLLELP